MVFLGHWTTPSGIAVDENAYILNLQEPPCSGYIDALSSHNDNENPNACGHLVNHDATYPNVQVQSVCWSDILEGGEDLDKNYFDLPNIVRSDNAPRYYFNGDNCEIVRYDDHDASVCGAVLCATRDIHKNQEVVLNYQLQPPLPSWAKHWYS